MGSQTPITTKQNQLYLVLILTLSLIIILIYLGYLLFRSQSFYSSPPIANPTPTIPPQPSPTISILKNPNNVSMALKGTRQQFSLPIKTLDGNRYSFQWEAYVNSLVSEEQFMNFQLPLKIVKHSLSNPQDINVTDPGISNGTVDGRPNVNIIANPPKSPIVHIRQNRDGTGGFYSYFINIQTGEIIDYSTAFGKSAGCNVDLPVNNQNQETLLYLCIKEDIDPYQKTITSRIEQLYSLNITTGQSQPLLSLNDQETFRCKVNYSITDSVNLNYLSNDSAEIDICKNIDKQQTGSLIRKEIIKF